jgi:hypothetical protein
MLGNCFGEEGVESIHEIMSAKGKADVLCSLSDDEGDDDV